MEREDGLYWIVLNGTWGVAEWVAGEGWDYNGYKVGGDEFFERIYNKIEDYGKKGTSTN